MRLLSLSFLLLVLISCKKEEQDNPPANTSKLEIGGDTFTIDKAYLHIYGFDTASTDTNKGARIIMSLFSSGLSVDTNQNGNVETEGNGYRIRFETSSQLEMELASGTYTLTGPGSQKVFTYNFGLAEPKGNLSGEGDIVTVEGGNLDVTSSNGEYIVFGNFNGTDLRTFKPGAFNFKYTGTFQVIDKR